MRITAFHEAGPPGTRRDRRRVETLAQRGRAASGVPVRIVTPTLRDFEIGLSPGTDPSALHDRQARGRQIGSRDGTRMMLDVGVRLGNS
jgi:hypothetical protein